MGKADDKLSGAVFGGGRIALSLWGSYKFSMRDMSELKSGNT
jgi:hypothetical protein